MSDPLLDKVGVALRQGKSEAALEAARAYCEAVGSTKDVGIAVARQVATVYRDLVAVPVHEFAANAELKLPPEVGPLVAKALTRLIKMTEEWEKKLWSVHTERLTREVRDWVRMRAIDPAAMNIARLMALVPDASRGKRATYIGSTLGTVINNQGEAKKLMALLARSPESYQLRADEVQIMEAARTERINKMIGVNLDNLEREFSTILTQTIVEIQNQLPDRGQMGEPDENVLRDVGDIFRSILRVPILRQEAELFLDATRIFVDFVPKEQSETSKVARVEGRVYNNLGYTAKKSVMMTFQEIGRNDFFTQMYKTWAEDYRDTDSLVPIVEVMGALRSTAFNDFLKSVKGTSQSMSRTSAQSRVSGALGTIAGEDAAEALMTELRKLLARRHIQTSEMREAERVISSLGNIIKSPRTSFEERNHIHEFLRTHVPEDLTKIALHTALEAFNAKISDQTAQQRQWAVRILTRALWMPDETTAHHKGEEKPVSELGFREEIVGALEKIAPHEIHTFVRAMEPLTSRYGMAFMAAAEVCLRLKAPETLPPLEAMLTHTLLHDSNVVSNYQQEFYWDAATQTRKPLGKEKVLGPIVYAIGTIGGGAGLEILRRYVEKISTGRVSAPPPEVAGFLQKFLGDNVFKTEMHVEETAEGSAMRMNPGDVRALIKQVKSHHWFSGKQGRRAKKIEALTRLAMSTPPEALDTIFEQLGNSDPMIVSAAITCLAEYAGPKKPKTLRDLTINLCLDSLEHKDPARRQSAIKLLKEIGPARKDVKDKVLAFAKNLERRETKEALARALKHTETGSDTLNTVASALEGGIAKHESGAGASGDALTKLEAKRQYLEARRQWIAGGKIGDPPSKPAGMD